MSKSISQTPSRTNILSATTSLAQREAIAHGQKSIAEILGKNIENIYASIETKIETKIER